jgi:hypothetical protein
MSKVLEGFLLKKHILLPNYENLFFRLSTRGLQCWAAVDENGEPKGQPKESLEKTDINSVYSMSGDTKFNLETDDGSWLLQGRNASNVANTST